MKESCVSAFARVTRWFALAAVALGLGAGTLHAQGSTGKIEGRVRDQAGAPIANAQVFIVGTAFSASTNPLGYYFINSVPAGQVSMKAQFVGYKPVQVAGLKISAGQTITQDFALEATPLEIATVEVVAAQNVLVPRDEVTTKQRVDGDYLEKLPVDGVNSVLALQPGVVASADGQTLSIRGGRPEESATYVDGVPVSGGFRNGNQIGLDGIALSVGTNAVDEASVTTGAASSEFGNAQSGIISLSTRTGGQKINGNLGYSTDEPLGVNHSLGFNRVQAGIGGPIPIVKNLSFFLSGVLQGQKSTEQNRGAVDFPIYVSAGVDTTVAVPSTVGSPTADTTMVDVLRFAAFRGDCSNLGINDVLNTDDPLGFGMRNNYGLKCQGARAPASARTLYQVSGKVNYTFGTGSRVFLSYLGSRNQGPFLSYGATIQNLFNSLYNPAQARGFRNTSNVFIASWNQNLSKSAERALSFEASVSYQRDRAIQSFLTPDSYNASRSPFGGFMLKPLHFTFDFDNFPIDQTLVNNFKTNAPGARLSPIDLTKTDQFRNSDLYRNDAYGLLGFSDGGGPDGGLFMYQEERYVGRGNLDWQVDRYNRLKLGGEFTRYRIANYGFNSINSTIFTDIFIEKPIRYDGFFEDRLDLGDVIVVGGLRYDFYDTRATRWKDFPRTFTAVGFNPANPDSLRVRDKSHHYISPHVQVSFPVTDRTNFRLSYSHQVQAPDFASVLEGINTDFKFGNTNTAWGTDLDFGKTISFEFGIRHAFNEDMVLDLSAYNRDNLSNQSVRLVSFFDPVDQKTVNIRSTTNLDFGNTRGVDLRLDRRFGNLFNGTLAYSYQDARNTGSDPFTYINFYSRIINQFDPTGAQPPPQAILPTNTSRPHNLAGSAALNFPSDWQRGRAIGSILQNVGVTATFRVASGTAYSRCPNTGGNEGVTSGGVCTNEFAGTYNGARLPTFKQFDLRVTKGFRLGTLDLSAYADVRNLFNFKNILQVFSINGTTTSLDEKLRNEVVDSSGFADEANANGKYNSSTGDIDLTFGGNLASGCGNWVRKDGVSAAPSCVYLIRAEERFGDGDHIFSLAEQTRASDALYNIFRGINNFVDAPRRIRLGIEINF